MVARVSDEIFNPTDLCSSARARAALEASKERIAKFVTEVVSARFEARIGPTRREELNREALDLLAYLGEALAAEEHTLFVEYVAWQKVMLAGRDRPTEELLQVLRATAEAVSLELGPELGRVAVDPLQAGIDSLPRLPAALPSRLKKKSCVGDLGQRYLELLLSRDRRSASRLILEAAEEGVPIKDIYLHVFQDALYEIGQLWQMNKVTVAEEHYCTAATQLIMSQLYSYIFSRGRIDRRVVLSCVSGNLHELSMRMVADFFEMAGWDTCYLGANTPSDSVLTTVLKEDAHLLAISATLTNQVRPVATLIEALRADSAFRKVKVLVGGYPFNLDTELWTKIGADGWAPDALAAVDVAGRLCPDERPCGCCG